MLTLTDFEKDTLKEIINIGIGNASSAVGKLMNSRVDLKVPSLYLSSLEKTAEIFGLAEELKTISMVRINGGTSGMMLVVYDPKSARKLAEYLTRQKVTETKLSELDESALNELTNIIAGSCLNALSRFLNLNLLQSIPDLSTGMLRALINDLIVNLGLAGEEILVLQSSFSCLELNADGQFYLLFTPKATIKILGAAKSKTAKI